MTASLIAFQARVAPSAEGGAETLLAGDLQDADVAHARCLAYLADRDAFGVRFADSGAPLGLGGFTALRCPPDAGEGHLPDSRDGVAEPLDGLRGAGVVERGGDAERLGLVAEAVVVGGFLAEILNGCHGGKDTYRG